MFNLNDRDMVMQSFHANRFRLTASAIMTHADNLRCNTDSETYKDHVLNTAVMRLSAQVWGREVSVEKHSVDHLYIPASWWQHLKSDLQKWLCHANSRTLWFLTSPYQTLGERLVTRLRYWIGGKIKVGKTAHEHTIHVHHNHMCPHINVAGHNVHMNFFVMPQPWLGSVEEQAILREMITGLQFDGTDWDRWYFEVRKLKIQYERAHEEYERIHRINYYAVAGFNATLEP